MRKTNPICRGESINVTRCVLGADYRHLFFCFSFPFSRVTLHRAKTCCRGALTVEQKFFSWSDHERGECVNINYAAMLFFAFLQYFGNEIENVSVCLALYLGAWWANRGKNYLGTEKCNGKSNERWFIRNRRRECLDDDVMEGSSTIVQRLYQVTALVRYLFQFLFASSIGFWTSKMAELPPTTRTELEA